MASEHIQNRTDRRGLRTAAAVLFGAATLAVAPITASAEDVPNAWPHPEGPGTLVVAAGQDSGSTYTWLPLSDQGRRLLVWEQGVLSIPDSLALRVPGRDFEVPYLPSLVGVSQQSGLRFEAGDYDIEHPLLLSDGRMRLYASGGRLRIERGSIVYVAAKPSTDPRASYLFLAALLIISFLLLARARSRLKKR
jgi:hypothetical protein